MPGQWANDRRIRVESLLPTTKHRRGRRTARQQAALDRPSSYLVQGPIPDLSSVLDGAPVVLDVGFGTGEAVIAYATADPSTRILAVDMHTPGIGDLLAGIEERGLTNVYVVEADVRPILTQAIPEGALIGVRTFFPDPWPKKRHHRRRVIQRDFADQLAACCATGAVWHIATDWPDYAEHIASAVNSSIYWQGGIIDRPADRPVTRFERRGIAAGRAPIDLRFVRVAP